MLVVVAGAGPVGCLAALLLSENKENQVLVVEKRGDPGAVAGGTDKSSLKSINLALSARGRAALRRVGLEDEILQNSVEMTGRLIHLNHGNTEVYQQYDDVEGNKSIYSVSRETVTEVLREKLFARANVQVEFNNRVAKLDLQNIGVRATLGTGRVVDCHALLGCDGSYSSVREAMSRVCCLDFHRTYIEMGYTELVVPKGSALRVNVLHIWPKEEEHGMMMIALPNCDGSFTATLFAPFRTLLTLQQDFSKYQEFLSKHFQECIPFLDLTTKCNAHPLFTSTVSPWNAGSVVLMGDAAHAQVPFFGQGMNAGLEDALVFYETLQQEGSWERATETFDAKRRPCGEAITVLSLENYVEMHTSSSRLIFRVSRRIQGLASTLLPRFMVSLPLYYQVAFTRRPYHDILQEKRQSPYWVAAGLTTAATLTALLLVVVMKDKR